MVFTRHNESFERNTLPIAYADGMSTPYSLTVKKDRVKPDKNNKYTLPGGLWVAQMADGAYGFLARANIKEKVSATQFKIDPYQLFKEGDVLTVVEPTLTVTVSAASVSQTLILTVSGVSATLTFEGWYGTTTTDAATEFAEKINKSGVMKNLVTAKSEAAVIHLYAGDGTTLHTVTTGGTGTYAVSDSGTMVASKPFGTVLSFDPDNPTLMNLSGSATTAVPIDGHIGVPGQAVMGIHCHATDWEHCDQQILSVLNKAHGLYKWAIPYCDRQIETQFGQAITFLD